MLVVEINKKTLAKLKRDTRLHGGIAKVARETRIHKTTVSRIIRNGTAEELTAAKIEKYFNPQPDHNAASSAFTN